MEVKSMDGDGEKKLLGLGFWGDRKTREGRRQLWKRDGAQYEKICHVSNLHGLTNLEFPITI